MIVEGKVLTASLVLKKTPKCIHSLVDTQYHIWRLSGKSLLHPHISCFFAKRSLGNITRGGKQTKSRMILDGLLVFVLLSFGKNTKISQGRHIYSRIFFELLRIILLTNLSSGGVIRVYTKMCLLEVVLTIISFR